MPSFTITNELAENMSKSDGNGQVIREQANGATYHRSILRLYILHSAGPAFRICMKGMLKWKDESDMHHKLVRPGFATTAVCTVHFIKDV